jgi:hypothetical protein
MQGPSVQIVTQPDLVIYAGLALLSALGLLALIAPRRLRR